MKEHRIVGLGCALLIALCIAGIARAQTVTFTAAPATAVGSATPALTWSTSPVATSCTASGDWTGTKAASGTQTLAAITSSKSYTLTCTFPTTANVPLAWVPPTENTDGSPLTNLASYRVLYGTSATALTQTRNVTAPASSTTVPNLANGTWFFALRAVSSTGAESDNSNVAQRVVAPASASATAAITVTPDTTPKPPTLLTAPLAINIPLDSGDGFKRTVAYTITTNGPGVLAGFVKVGTPTLAELPAFSYRGQNYCRFLLKHPRTGAPNVAWDKGFVPTQDVAAPCA